MWSIARLGAYLRLQQTLAHLQAEWTRVVFQEIADQMFIHCSRLPSALRQVHEATCGMCRSDGSMPRTSTMCMNVHNGDGRELLLPKPHRVLKQLRPRGMAHHKYARGQVRHRGDCSFMVVNGCSY